MEQVQYHKHTGVDSPRISGSSIDGAPLAALTVKTALSPGGSYTASEQTIIANLQTRLNELESRLQSIGLLQ